MGEYAKRKSDGERVKIGTCEDLYYLRADQCGAVLPEQGSVDPSSEEHRKHLRFRFPWPDEDRVEPGAFEPYARAVGLRGVTVPEDVEHHLVQFTAPGYVVSLPCPEGPDADPRVHRNGFPGAVLIQQQAYRNGNLALVCRCGGCGAKFSLPTWEDAEPYVEACRVEGERTKDRSKEWWYAVAYRIAAGYADQYTGE